MKKFLLILAGCILLVVAAFYALNAYIYNEKQAEEDKWKFGAEEAFTPQFPNENNNGLVISPKSVGTELVADQAYLEKPGFIVIHEIENDSPGAVLGTSALLQAGIHHNVPITVALSAHSIYFALLYADDGDGIFVKGKDTLLPLYLAGTKTYSDRAVLQFETL